MIKASTGSQQKEHSKEFTKGGVQDKETSPKTKIAVIMDEDDEILRRQYNLSCTNSSHFDYVLYRPLD